MKRSVIREPIVALKNPDYAALHPGYDTAAVRFNRWIKNVHRRGAETQRISIVCRSDFSREPVIAGACRVGIAHRDHEKNGVSEQLFLILAFNAL